MLNFFLLYKYTITNFEKSSIVPVIYLVVMADQFNGLDTSANRTRKIVHTCNLQHACCFAHKKDCTTCHLLYVSNLHVYCI